MRNATALDDAMAAALGHVESADIVVGIPSYRNAGTIGHVVRTVVQGLRGSFGHMRAVIVNADGGSNDGTTDAVRAALDGHPAVVGEYRGIPGKGSAFRAIFEAAAHLGASSCAVVDSDLRSITPQWIERLLGPVCAGHTDYVTPLYARHKHDGTITNTIAYPVTRALYGARVRQPIGGEFGFSGALAKAFLEGGALGGNVWDTDVAKFGIDIYMTTTALVRRARIAQAFLGAKVHDPKDPGSDLGPMFRQVVGTLFRMAARNAEAWRAVDGSETVRVVGVVETVDPEAVNADVRVLDRKLEEGKRTHEAEWREVLSSSSLDAVADGDIDAGAWARIVFDMLGAAARAPERTDAIVDSLVPLYYGRVARFIRDAERMTTAQAERLVEEQAVAFERAKSRLVERWQSA